MHSNSNGRMSINLKEDGVETDKVKKINGQIHVADILVQDEEDKLFGKCINGVDEQSPLNWVSKSADEQFDDSFWDEFDDKTSSLDTKSSDEQSDACSSTPEAHYDRANSLPFSSSINIFPSPDLSLSTPPQAGGGLRHCVTAPVSRNRSFILDEEEIEFSRSMFEKRNKPRHDLRLDRLSEHDKQKLIVELVRIQNDGTVEVDLTKNAPVASELLELQTVEDSLPNVDRIVTDFNKSVPKLQIAMLVVGTRGDVQPFLAMAKKLQEFGHRVRLATHINFRDFVKSAGVEFYPLGGDPRVLSEYMARNKGLVPSAPGEISVQRKQLKAIIQSLLPACTEPDIETGQPFRVQAIIANPPAYGHAHVAEALEVPIHIFFTMPWTPTSEFPHPLARVPQSAGYWLSYILVDLLIWWGIRSYINDFRKKKLNLPPIAYFSTYHGSISHLPTGYIWSPHVVPKPRDWGPLVDVVGYCFLNLGSNYQPPDAFAQWIQSGPKPIYIGFGSMPLGDSKKTTEIILEALKSTGQRGIIDRGWGGLGNCPGIPETVYLISDCPHDWLFPQCSAVIHHGGAGTTATGLRAGCPTTIVPFFGDQYFWGDRVHEKGLGPPPIPISQLSIENLSDAIKFMLQPEVKSQAMELATFIENEDGVTGAVDAFHRHLPPELPLPTSTSEEDDDDRPPFLQWLFIRIGKICSLPCESQVLEMAISIAAATVCSLTTKHQYSASPFAPSSSTMLSHLSSLQFPRELRSLRMQIHGSKSQSRRRAFPLVEAKKQSFSSLDDLLANYDKPILVDFYATWCGPCQFMVPVLNEVSDSMKDKIQVVKIDTEKYPSIADKYQIQALPTFILFKDGKPCDRFEGALAAKQLIERIESALRS